MIRVSTGTEGGRGGRKGKEEEGGREGGRGGGEVTHLTTPSVSHVLYVCMTHRTSDLEGGGHLNTAGVISPHTAT